MNKFGFHISVLCLLLPPLLFHLLSSVVDAKSLLSQNVDKKALYDCFIIFQGIVCLPCETLPPSFQQAASVYFFIYSSFVLLYENKKKCRLKGV